MRFAIRCLAWLPAWAAASLVSVWACTTCGETTPHETPANTAAKIAIGGGVVVFAAYQLSRKRSRG